MGLDIAIYRARNHKIFESEDWYKSPEVEEVYYARNFWALLEQASFINMNDDNSDYIKLSRKNIEELLQIAIHNEDNSGTFYTVPELCRILYDFETNKEEGYHYYLGFSY